MKSPGSVLADVNPARHYHSHPHQRDPWEESVTSKLRPVTVGILGSGEVTTPLVNKTLNQQFRMGPEDPEGYFGASDKYQVCPVIPAGTAHTSQGVHAFWEWAIRCELGYTVLTDGTANKFTADIIGNCEGDDVLLGPSIDASMIGHLKASKNPMLLVTSRDAEIDPATAEVAAQALRAQIPVYDLSRMLLEITWRHLPDHTPPEIAVEEEENGQFALADIPGLPSIELSSGEVARVLFALTRTEEFLTVVEADVLAHTDDLRRCLTLGRSLLSPKAPPVPEGVKTKLEVFNPETGVWEPAGRGRPSKKLETRKVPVVSRARAEA